MGRLRGNGAAVAERAAAIRVPEVTSMVGAIEGAERRDRETVDWIPSFMSPDRAINPIKPLADARGRDMAANDGYSRNAIDIPRDSIVGAQYRLNAKPAYSVIGATAAWAEAFQAKVEGMFNLLAEAPSCIWDAGGRNTFSQIIRLNIAVHAMSGEALMTSEWNTKRAAGWRTMFQTISPDRLCNPNSYFVGFGGFGGGSSDTYNMRRGVERDNFGRPLFYNIRTTNPGDFFMGSTANGPDPFTWARVPAAKKWGRPMVFHAFEQDNPDQSRGIAAMVSVLKRMKMAKKFSEVTLQNAVIQASYAAAIESELPPEIVAQMMGASQSTGGADDGLKTFLGTYMGMLQKYLSGAGSIGIDGAKIPHFFPGTKLNVLPLGTPGGIGTNYEASLLRSIAAGLGLSYEELSRDYSQVSYSSARASIQSAGKAMQSRKKNVADYLANLMYGNIVEEWVQNGMLPLPPGKTANWFYDPMVREALTRCTWIGTGRGQIDELKETQAAVMRIAAGLSTYEKEIAQLGGDYRENFEQMGREQALMQQYGLTFNLTTLKPTANNALVDSPSVEVDPNEEDDTPPAPAKKDAK